MFSTRSSTYLYDGHELELDVSVSNGLVRLARGQAWLLPDAGGVNGHRAAVPIHERQDSHEKSRIFRESRINGISHETSPKFREKSARLRFWRPDGSHEKSRIFRASHNALELALPLGVH